MSSPYTDLPDSAYWRRAVSSVAPQDVDPALGAKLSFQIESGDRVMTAGSCFAQHIARYLTAAGFNLLISEPPHPIASAKIAADFNYGVFTARYGNIYTTRQLLQLLHRAYGDFLPQEDIWKEGDRFVDPFRPRIQPGGFATLEEYQADRQRHFAAVRRAFEELDVLIFTLGLTESWCSSLDGAVFPVCPGVAGGVFDETRHRFHNFDAAEVTADLLAFIDGLRRVNPSAKVLLTVSPVPLVATAEPRHVIVSTVYSKSVLRVACEQVCARREMVQYFPSYEVIAGSFSRGAYFGPDAREVTEQGVSHVMRLFFRHMTNAEIAPVAAAPMATAGDNHVEKMSKAVAVICEEELLDSGAAESPARMAGRRARREARALRKGGGRRRGRRRGHADPAADPG